MNPQPMIQLEGVSRTFTVGGRPVRALREVSLEIAAGDYVSIMGPSGSGKSTLLNILGCLDRPDTGSYRLEGRETANLSATELSRVRRHSVGFVFQFFHLVPRMTAAENIELPLVFAGVEPSVRRDRVAHALAAVNLGRRSDHRPAQLSGGEQQRVAIARAVVTDPAVLLADEPTGNLDTTVGGEIVNLLEGLNDEGRTLVVVTHNPEIGERARRRIRLQDGRVASVEEK